MSKGTLTFVFVLVILALCSCSEEPQSRQEQPKTWTPKIQDAGWCYDTGYRHRHLRGRVSQVLVDSMGGVWLVEHRNNGSSITFRRVK